MRYGGEIAVNRWLNKKIYFTGVQFKMLKFKQRCQNFQFHAQWAMNNDGGKLINLRTHGLFIVANVLYTLREQFDGRGKAKEISFVCIACFAKCLKNRIFTSKLSSSDVEALNKKVNLSTLFFRKGKLCNEELSFLKSFLNFDHSQTFYLCFELPQF